MSEPVVIVAARRTPIGAFQGALSPLTAPQLGSAAIEAALRDSGLKPEQVDEVIMGCVLMAGIGQAPARQAALAAGLPTQTPATTINKMCGSGLKAIMMASNQIAAGDANAIVAGGLESMSNAPYLIPRARQGLRMGHAELIDHMFYDGLQSPFDGKLMGTFAEATSQKYGFTRGHQDEFAAESVRRAVNASDTGVFANEIAAVTRTPMRRFYRIAPLLLATLFAACSEGGSDRAVTTEEQVDYAEVEQGGGATASAPVTVPAEGVATGTDQGMQLEKTWADIGESGVAAEQRRLDAAPPGTQPPTSPAQPDPASAPAAPGNPAPVRMIIRTGNATLEVTKLEPAINRVQQMAQQLGGYVANTSMQTGRQNAREATLELKIPAARWDQAVAALRPLGKLESMTTGTQDVGEEYVDVTARMNNARRLEDRLVELLASRTGRLEDVLAVERELARVREQIERYEGRLRFLRSRVANSTLTVRLHEPMPVIGGRPGGNPIMEAFRTAWDNFMTLVVGLIAMMGWLLPLLVLAAAAVWLFLRFMRWNAESGDKFGLGMGRGGTPGSQPGPPPADGPGTAGAPADPGAGPAAPGRPGSQQP